MSRIVSFAWTTPALLAGAKTCTRRQWPESYYRHFTIGMLLDAYNRGPRFKGSHVADLRLLDLYQERTSNMPDADYANEGLLWMEQHGLLIPATLMGKKQKVEPAVFWKLWKEEDMEMTVVRFKLLQKIPLPLDYEK